MARSSNTGLKVAGGVGAAALIALIFWQIDENEKRKRAQQAAALALRAQQFVISGVAHVANVLGVPAPPVTFDTGCENAWTDGKSICFNTAWAVHELTASCNGDVCAWNRILAVCAHEVGHIVDPTWKQGHPWNDEYFADRVAGWVLGKLNMGLDDFLVIMQSWQGSFTHPPGSLRIPKVIQGYQEATGHQILAA
jgi:hypothetical protein